MGTSDASPKKPAVGFLTVVEHPQHGLFGGYLVLNLAGRPLEFHCTAPLRPNRAQQILYGPTLNSFLYGEQIGQTLLQQAKNEPLLVCTDRVPALAVREHVLLPVALVLGAGESVAGGLSPFSSERTRDCHPSNADAPECAGDQRLLRFDAAHTAGCKLSCFQVGCNHLAVPERCEDDRRLIVERLADLSESFDLAEPFGRIREAIEEAQQAVRQDG